MERIITDLQRRSSMRHDDAGLVPHRGDVLQDLGLRPLIQRAGRLVQEEDRRFRQQCSGDRDTLRPAQ